MPATQRLLTPFRVRQLTRRLAEGERVEREALVGAAERHRLSAHRRGRTTPANTPCAGRSSTSSRRASPTALRLDFFGDEIETHAPLRSRRPAHDRDQAEAFTLMPASEALLDEDSVKRFRTRYREQFGATATGDPLYQAVSEGRRLAGMEHWLPLFEDKLATLFDHLGDDDLILRDGGADGALEARARGDRGLFHQPRARRWPPSRAATGRCRRARSILPEHEWRRGGRRAADPPRLALPRAAKAARVIDFGVEPARDFAPERAQQANIYEAVAEHVAKLRKNRQKVVLASYTPGRARAARRPARRPWPQDR